jgi:membrane protein implicated in regulation of membrane protease activity
MHQSFAVAALCAWSAPALAYVGPGAGISLIGLIVGLVAAVFLAIAGFLWYPVKRYLRSRKQPREGSSE